MMTQPHSGLNHPTGQYCAAEVPSRQHASATLLQLLARAVAGQALRQVAAELSNCESAEPQEAFSGHRGG